MFTFSFGISVGVSAEERAPGPKVVQNCLMYPKGTCSRFCLALID